MGMIVNLKEEPLIAGIFILILLTGILLLFFMYAVYKRLDKSCEEQEKLKVSFDDQMFLFGRYYKELLKLDEILSELNRILPRGGNSGEKNTKDEKHLLSEGKRLIEEKVRKLGQDANIEIRELCWYEKPKITKAKYPHILVVSSGIEAKELEFSEEELADFPSVERIDTTHRISAMMNQLRKTRHSIPM